MQSKIFISFVCWDQHGKKFMAHEIKQSRLDMDFTQYYMI